MPIVGILTVGELTPNIACLINNKYEFIVDKNQFHFKKNVLKFFVLCYNQMKGSYKKEISRESLY